MAELLPPGLDGVRGLSLGADNFADYTLPMEELVTQSSSLLECDVDVNPPAIPLEAHGSRFCAGVIASESLNAFQLQEKEEKLHLARINFH